MSRQTRRLERRSERQARQVGNTPRPTRARVSRTPVKVGGGSSFPLQQLAIGAAIVLIVGLIVFAYIQSTKKTDSTPAWIKAELDSSESLPGTYVQPNPGPDGNLCTNITCAGSMDDRNHVTTPISICTADQLQANDIGTCYNSNPPTSGNHNPQPAAFKIYDNPVPRENLVHSMEHGGVIVWYNTDNQDVINQLKSVVQSELDRRKQVVMSKYTEMEPDTIALTAWTRLDKFSVGDFNKDRVKTFIEKLNKHFNPENF